MAKSDNHVPGPGRMTGSKNKITKKSASYKMAREGYNPVQELIDISRQAGEDILALGAEAPPAFVAAMRRIQKDCAAELMAYKYTRKETEREADARDAIFVPVIIDSGTTDKEVKAQAQAQDEDPD